MSASRVLVLGLAAGAAACGTDPTLAIEVHHATGSQIARTTVSVYASPTLTCDDVQFGDVDDATLAGLAVAEETLVGGNVTAGSLAGLPRVAHKVIAARGFGADGKLADGGCVEADEITADTTLAIDAQAAVLASISAGSDAYAILVTVANLDGSAVAGRAVSWRVIGPDGTMPADPSKATVLERADATWDRPTATCTGPTGTAVIHPVPPDLSGGYAARVRVAWAQESPAPLSALTKLTPGQRALTPVAGMAHPCAIGHSAAGSPASVVACANASGTVDVFSVGSTAGAVTYTTVASPALAAPVGIFAVPGATAGDTDVIAIDAGNTPAIPGTGRLVKITGGSTVAACPECNSFVDAMYVPPCGTAKALLLGRTKDNVIRALSPLGGAATKFGAPDAPLTQAIAFVTAGCVTRFDTTGVPTQVQLAVFDYVAKLSGRVVATSATIDCAGPVCISTALKVPGAGVAFTGGVAPALVVSSVDATGVILSTVDIVSTGSQNVFLELSRIASAAVPHRIATGQLDADGQLDLVWDNVTKADPFVQIAYARAGFSGNLSALTGLALGDASILDVQAAPLVDAIHADALVVTSSGVVVLPSLVPAQTGTVPTDPASTCPN